MRIVTRSMLLIAVALSAVAAFAQLNPTVKVLQRPTVAVPPECGEGLAPQQAQRLSPEERTSVRDTSRDLQPPPSSTLRGELDAAIVAAQQSNREGFRDALARAKALLVSYPPGGEKSAATDLVATLDDLDKIWDYQFTSPTGSFFDVTGEPYQVAKKYPGYEAYVRRQTIVDQNGIKFYPTHETRDFLLTETGTRATRLTGRPAAPPPAPPRPTVRTTGVTAPAAKHVATTTPKPRSKPATTTKHAKRTTRKAVTHVARATTEQPQVKKRESAPPQPKPTPPPSPVTTTHAAPPPPPATTSSTPPPSATAQTTSFTDTMVAPRAATETTATMPTTSTTTSATSTPTSTTTAGEKPAQSRSFFGPIFLIIIGVGVLVMLWRASS